MTSLVELGRVAKSWRDPLKWGSASRAARNARLDRRYSDFANRRFQQATDDWKREAPERARALRETGIGSDYAMRGDARYIAAAMRSDDARRIARDSAKDARREVRSAAKRTAAAGGAAGAAGAAGGGVLVARKRKRR